MVGSASTQILPSSLYPPGFEKITNLKSVCVWKTTAPTKFVLDRTTIHNVVGGLEVFRGGRRPGDRALKYERHLIAESTGGAVSMIGPFKNVPPLGHYPKALPPWAVTRLSTSSGA
jgi:hypothetical protein